MGPPPTIPTAANSEVSSPVEPSVPSQQMLPAPCTGGSCTDLSFCELRSLFSVCGPKQGSKWSSWWCGLLRKLSHTSAVAFIYQTSDSLLCARFPGCLLGSRAGWSFLQGWGSPELLLRPTCISSMSRTSPPPAGGAGSMPHILAQEGWTLGKHNHFASH